ncbi:MAG: hypothetical protein V2I82_08605, partial [Halieaceae bacterium]|nr:hypothetical protein [Halieaceae bacterium]
HGIDRVALGRLLRRVALALVIVGVFVSFALAARASGAATEASADAALLTQSLVPTTERAALRELPLPAP